MAHMPVLATAAVAALGPRDGGVYVDATFGGGGYTRLLLAAARCRVVAMPHTRSCASRSATGFHAYIVSAQAVQRRGVCDATRVR